MRNILALSGCLGLLVTLAACDKEEQAHEVHLTKGTYAGKPMTKLDDKQVSALERRAAKGNY